MNATKALVTGAVALTAFASVLGLAYAQVENTDPNAQTQQQQYPSTQTDPTQQAVPAEQSMTPADQPASGAEQSQSQQMQTESQSQQTQPQSSDQWQNQQQPATQDPLPSEPTAAGTPAPRADRN
ncbi:MAG: hypothetical protein J7598_09570 [Mitsuaria chitosanitabida]|jgi:hypothetical protein|uniref:hypothetical protein n=1 Tax=Roseateles chitosanitabidus TaxID=65048 RepID=UPI001B218AE5|nr:hypothetical protein [Roseateles chitosanitabidus]MBO9686848.1 hypothetical protein [Roseateles chitosanitabidus]